MSVFHVSHGTRENMNPKSRRNRNPRKPLTVLAYDLGGTKFHVAVVTERGKILREWRDKARFDLGKAAVLRQLTDVGTLAIQEFPEIAQIGMASAGPLDPAKGLLLDPTNFAGPEGRWGTVPICKILSSRLKRPCVLENDAAAAMLAEHWKGEARKVKNAMILTLGTGLGTGVLIEGRLARAGRGLHTEAGHLILNENDTSARCGCGNLGCAEAYLSGNGFARWAVARKWAKKGLSSKEIAAIARTGNSKALHAFEEYASKMATAIHNYAVIYAPQKIILTGSFADSADLFLPALKKKLKETLGTRRSPVDLMPEVCLSSLDNHAGVLGGAYIAFEALKASRSSRPRP